MFHGSPNWDSPGKHDEDCLSDAPGSRYRGIELGTTKYHAFIHCRKCTLTGPLPVAWFVVVANGGERWIIR